MTNPAPGTLAWFEVATSDPDGAEKFYGSLFDWSFNADGPAASGGMDYRNITASGDPVVPSGIFTFGSAGKILSSARTRPRSSTSSNARTRKTDGIELASSARVFANCTPTSARFRTTKAIRTC